MLNKNAHMQFGINGKLSKKKKKKRTHHRANPMTEYLKYLSTYKKLKYKLLTTVFF